MESKKFLSCTVHHTEGEAPWMRLAVYEGSHGQKPEFLIEQPLDSVEDATDLRMWMQMVLARACDVA
jgi:hypothetical protein